MSHYFETCWAQKGSPTSFFVRNLLLLKIILEPVCLSGFLVGEGMVCNSVSQHLTREGKGIYNIDIQQILAWIKGIWRVCG